MLPETIPDIMRGMQGELALLLSLQQRAQIPSEFLDSSWGAGHRDLGHWMSTGKGSTISQGAKDQSSAAESRVGVTIGDLGWTTEHEREHIGTYGRHSHIMHYVHMHKLRLPVVQKQVGHRTLKATSVYLRPSDEAVAQACESAEARPEPATASGTITVNETSTKTRLRQQALVASLLLLVKISYPEPATAQPSASAVHVRLQTRFCE